MDRRIEAVLARLNSEPPGTWTVASLAKPVGLSASRLRHLFKQEMGETLTHHLRTIRARRAAHLLQTTYLSIKQIADEVGPFSSSHFTREFRRVFGVSPTTYRKRLGSHSKSKNRRLPKS